MAFSVFTSVILCFSVISNCIALLVQDLEGACDPALTAMSKVTIMHASSTVVSRYYDTAGILEKNIVISRLSKYPVQISNALW